MMKEADFHRFLFTKYYQSLWAFAWQMVRENALAEDLVQDAFMHYIQYRNKVSSEERAVKSFLYSSIKFAVFNISRKNKIIRKFWERTSFQEADDVDYEYAIIHGELMAVVYDSLTALPDSCRKVMTLSYVDGFSNQEIASLLQISVNTVKTQKLRGIRVLRGKVQLILFTLPFFNMLAIL